MSQLFDPVFGDWYTETQLGSGTDGKAFTIVRTDETGKKHRAVLKTIRVGDYRNEKKSFNTIGDRPAKPTKEERQHQKIIRNITENIDIIRQTDGGRHFVKYEEWEKRQTSDGKGTLILIRLEEMRSLADLLTQFSLTREETLRLGISVCRSLIRLRDFGYIYPNLKPENILFDRKGVCKLGDFGSFSCLEPAKSSIAFKRTQYYAAPEYITTGKINCTADTYSLGLVLYTLINRGRLPFTEPYPQELTIGSFDRSKENRIAGNAFPPPALFDEALCKIIGKACARKPEDRYLSPKQMLQDLESALANQPFGKVEFEDVYSASESEEPQDVPAAPEDIPMTPDSEPEPESYEAPYQAPEAPVDEAPPVDLREEIQIPETAPYAPAENPDAQTQDEYVASPAPKGKKPRKERKRLGGRFFLALLLVICLIALLVVSISIRLKGEQPTTTVSPEAVAMIAPVFGGFLYGV